MANTVVLMAPHELVETTIILPRPAFGDDENLDIKVQYDQSMNGTIYSYIQTSLRRTFSHNHLLTQDKAEELRRFFVAYSVANIRMYNYDDSVWLVKFEDKELSFTTQFNTEIKQVSLNYIGTKLA